MEATEKIINIMTRWRRFEAVVWRLDREGELTGVSVSFRCGIWRFIEGLVMEVTPLERKETR